MTRSDAPRLLHRIVRVAAVPFLLVGFPGHVPAQTPDRDARLPHQGELWIEAAPGFENWSEQFSAGNPALEAGRREPLATHFDGPITDRLFPGIDPLLAVVNADADALGFDPLAGGDVSLGSLESFDINIEQRRVPFSLQFGVLDRVALEVSAPLVRTEVAPGFVFDSSSATVVRADAAVSQTFLDDLESARTALRTLVDGGSLTPEQEASAVVLLDQTGRFSEALSDRLAAQGFLFTAGSLAGQQITGTYSGWNAGFSSLGLSLPSLALPPSATSADLDAYFRAPPVEAQPLDLVRRGWSLGPIEIGARVRLLDTFGRPEDHYTEPPSTPVAQEAVSEERPAAPESEAQEDQEKAAEPAEEATAPDARAAAGREGAVPSPAAPTPQEQEAEAARREAAEAALRAYRRGVHLRTSVGVRYRFRASSVDRAPYVVPDVFLQQPIADGAAAWELELRQDVAVGPTLFVAAGARYGIRRADSFLRRIAAPDRPFAVRTQEAVVEREAGNYLELRLSPRLFVSDALAVGLEYTYWNKKRDEYSVVEGAAASAAPLQRESAETRHGLGVGAYYRTTLRRALGLSSVPVELSFVYQASLAGRGGRTPASEMVTGTLRVPLRLY